MRPGAPSCWGPQFADSVPPVARSEPDGSVSCEALTQIVPPAPPPDPVTVDETAEASENALRAARKRGRAASILTSADGVGDAPGSVAVRKLLGGSS